MFVTGGLSTGFLDFGFLGAVLLPLKITYQFTYLSLIILAGEYTIMNRNVHGLQQKLKDPLTLKVECYVLLLWETGNSFVAADTLKSKTQQH